MITKTTLKTIDRAIKDLWINELYIDYRKGYFINKDSLRCSFYHHLQTTLSPLFNEKQLYLYPNFYVTELNLVADLAIVHMDMTLNTKQMNDKMTYIATIIELNYRNETAMHNDSILLSDTIKLKQYAQAKKPGCQYYCACIHEAENDYLDWLTLRSQQPDRWLEGAMSELNAGYMGDHLFFEVNSGNHFNYRHKRTSCETTIDG